MLLCQDLALSLNLFAILHTILWQSHPGLELYIPSTHELSKIYIVLSSVTVSPCPQRPLGQVGFLEGDPLSSLSSNPMEAHSSAHQPALM